MACPFGAERFPGGPFLVYRHEKHTPILQAL